VLLRDLKSEVCLARVEARVRELLSDSKNRVFSFEVKVRELISDLKKDVFSLEARVTETLGLWA